MTVVSTYHVYGEELSGFLTLRGYDALAKFMQCFVPFASFASFASFCEILVQTLRKGVMMSLEGIPLSRPLIPYEYYQILVLRFSHHAGRHADGFAASSMLRIRRICLEAP